MASWKKTIASPFKKACTFFNNQPQQSRDPNHKKSHHHDQLQENENSARNLHGEVMACGYEDVQVMWSILDKSKSTPFKITSS
ncbi:hypothetical protein CsatB_007896 [Cannabis sativa]|uniref:Uncharacterized protein n=2 Tax=Cannabis sativa TaxID=3483 RepID=A0AB40E9M0_CANSA|nr:uncharacterized protein LOC115702478 [Cannabis sativa]KAF4349390.1 hypothetical protein F8388_012560 [Cannabis sativa]KAF4370482.1 hypothetical protein G4B88_005203 [Cannabis sativa]